MIRRRVDRRVPAGISPMTTSWTFRLPAGASPDELAQNLAKRFPVQREEDLSERYTYLDTWDGRLFAAGATLDLRRNPHGALLRWKDASGSVRHRTWVEDVPRFAWDVPPGPLRDALLQAAGMRRLLPVVEVSSESRGFRALNDERKTFARLRLERLRVRLGAGTSEPERTLPWRLRVLPLRGYAEEAAALAAGIERSFGFERDEPAELAACLRALGREPARPRGRLRVPLLPGIPAGEAVRRVLAVLARSIRAVEPGLRDDLDPLFLEEFRGAVARTVTATAALADALPEAAVRFAPEFSWLLERTEPAAAATEALLAVRTFRLREAPETERELEPLDAALEKARANAAQELRAVLEGERYADLGREWERCLLPGGDWPRSARPASEWARAALRRARTDLVERSAAALAERTPEARALAARAARALAHLLEFFAGLIPPDRLEGRLEAARRLAEALERAARLPSVAASVAGAASRMEAGPAALIAAGRVVEHLHAAAREAAKEAEGRLAEAAESGRAAREPDEP
ncbi:MAG: CHAD domain-containing protein [Acidobacteria bacterium]|nr:MAG: CHAD domain-containing protein [Acidobacteriota bacterium]